MHTLIRLIFARIYFCELVIVKAFHEDYFRKWLLIYVNQLYLDICLKVSVNGHHLFISLRQLKYLYRQNVLSVNYLIPDNYHFNGVKPFSTKLWSFIFKHITCNYFFNCLDYHHGVIHIVVLLWFKDSLKSKDLLLIKLSLFSLLQTYAINFQISY